jgi:hypothetical protein
VEVSPDLTRNDREKQGPGGRPITIEGAGGETYNTIFYVAESPLELGTIWVGSDDGLVHLTRDGGQEWDNVTPSAVGEAMINSIEASPHDPATAYLAVTRYKFNDFTPHIFKTADYGKSWERMVSGIAEDAWVRVVREDPARKGLLYAGTETGMYVSFDGGNRWQSLQLNLPVTPITDLKVQSNDLVAATQGRSFWILDDLSPLQQVDDEMAAAKVHLYRPRPAHRVAGAETVERQPPRLGKNPPNGAIIDFVIAEVPESPLTVEILDSAGEVIRTYSSEKKEEKDEKKEEASQDEDEPKPLKVKAGMNRFAWDLRYEKLPSIPKFFVFGSIQGRKVVPGTYQVRLTVGDETRTESVEVVKDPRVDASAKDFEEQDGFLVSIDEQLTEIHQAVIRLRAVRDQVEDLMKRAKDHSAGEAIQEAGNALVEKLTALEDELIQTKTVDGQTVINFPARLNHHYIFLRSAVDAAEGRVTDGARQRFADLSAQWAEYQTTLENLEGEALAEFNSLVQDSNVPAVIVPKVTE